MIDDERKTCPFKTTPDTTFYCTENCMLSIPCEYEPNGVTYSIAEIARQLIQKDEN